MYEIPRGDTSPSMSIQVIINGAQPNLSDVSDQNLRWRKPDGTVVTVPVTPVTLTKGLFKRTWVAGDTDQAGEHQGLLILVRGDGSTETFPSSGQPFKWKVKALPF